MNFWAGVRRGKRKMRRQTDRAIVMRVTVNMRVKSDGDNRKEEYCDTNKGYAFEHERLCYLKPKFHFWIISAKTRRVKPSFVVLPSMPKPCVRRIFHAICSLS
jgi:hypothetical protein